MFMKKVALLFALANVYGVFQDFPKNVLYCLVLKISE